MPSIEQLLAVLQIDPDDPVTHFSLARAYSTAGDVRRAVEHYRQAVALKADYAAAWFDWARLAESEGDREAAAAAYRGALAASSGTGDDHILKAARVRLERLERRRP